MQDLSQNKELLDQYPFGLLVISSGPTPQILYFNKFFADIGFTKNHNLSDLKDLQDVLQKNAQEPGLISFQDHKLETIFQNGLWQNEKCILLWAYTVSPLKEKLDQALSEVTSKANFIAMMSHEMRTPMQAVFGLLELISLEKPSRNVMDMINVAKISASGMLEILDDMLDLAKMDASKMELDLFEIPVRTLIRGVLEALSVKTEGKPIQLIDEIDSDVPFVILGDPKRLRQILINLTGNALKFTQSGFVKIHVGTKAKTLAAPESGINLRFEVVDSGIGMNPTILTKLFNSFTQADSSTARKFGGTGLGLSISKKLVEIMNGAIGVESEEKKGSTFWFEIPTQEINSSSPHIEMPDLKGLSVLSVEDHPQGAKEIVTSLRSMGANVETCGTYATALAMVKKRTFDVGIIDQGLPDGLGVDLIREISEIRPFMGILMYTVRDDDGLLHSLQALGIRFLGKPASRLGLGQAVLAVANKNIQVHFIGPTRLLIAEDTLSVQDLFRRQLKTLGCEADFVRNGQQALQAILTGKYGILFTDLHMPDMDGTALVKAIREREKETGIHIPVIVLTADIQMAQPQIYLEQGFDECLLKPVSLGHFRRLLIRLGILKDEGNFIPRNQTLREGMPSAIDMDSIIDQMGAFDQSAKEMLGFFGDMTEPLLLKLRQAHQDNNLKDVSGIAHSIKGAAYSACALQLGNLAAKIQTKADSGKNSAELIQEIFLEFDHVRQSIHDLVKD